MASAMGSIMSFGPLIREAGRAHQTTPHSVGMPRCPRARRFDAILNQEDKAARPIHSRLDFQDPQLGKTTGYGPSWAGSRFRYKHKRPGRIRRLQSSSD